MTISPARTAAFDILMRIERDSAFSSVLLPQYESGLNEKDRRLCHEIVLGVLRRKMYLDRVAAALSNDRRQDLEVATAIRIGLFQLIYLDRVPPHSSINESVDLAVRAKKSSAKGFVNAILRSFTRRQPALEFEDESDKLSVEESHPRWLVERWIEQFGRGTATALCQTNNQTPKIAFRPVVTGEKRFTQLENEGEIRRSEFVSNCYIAERFSRTLRDLSDKNAIYFQDEGSQLVAQAVINLAPKRILDVCAAPGGKTSMIARGTDASVVAGDIHFARVERLRETCKKQLLDIPIVQLDAENSLPFEGSSFDIVFVDAPCSGTGTIRHNPEIRYSLDPGDPDSLSDKQLRILRNASELVSEKGVLVYSTCSLEKEENEAVAGKFLDANNRFVLETPRVEGRFLTAEGYARTLPHRDGMDGFFIAVFRRN